MSQHRSFLHPPLVQYYLQESMGLLLQALACYFVILISVIVVKITDITSFWCHIVQYKAVLGVFLSHFPMMHLCY